MLKLGFKFADLYSLDGIRSLDKLFMQSALQCVDLLELARLLEGFITSLFGLEKEVAEMCEFANNYSVIYECKRKFIQRYAKDYQIVDAEEKLKGILASPIVTEELYVQKANVWLHNKDDCSAEIKIAGQYAFDQMQKLSSSALFSMPEKLDCANLIKYCETNNDENEKCIIADNPSGREGFNLTDNGLSDEWAMTHAKYCIYCHFHNKDSCSKGLYNANGAVKESLLRNKLSGCPLKQKISEMNLLKAEGKNIAALAVIMIDNPLCAATGHRICNDCMRSCIYQKQEPVNIPGVETNILANVLSLPYGFEIYSLLTRWNPLNKGSSMPKDETSHRVLVVGSGPAGFSLSHYLLNEGHSVVMVEGLKLEPLPEHLSGISASGDRVAPMPIRDVSSIYDALNERMIYGFGGVAEYGITCRWNKNYLKIIRMILERREHFRLYGSVRFAGNITYNDAIDYLGFDYIALATGAGSPRIPDIDNLMVSGVRMASDFLMSLQMNAVYQMDSLANFQVVLPVLVIGAGLTAVDTATEALAYYPVQVEKLLMRYEKLSQKHGRLWVEQIWCQSEKSIAKIFIEHALHLRKIKGNKKLVLQFLNKSGGVKIVYRRAMKDSPAYKLNHEELSSALREGVQFIERTEPISVLGEDYVCGLKVMSGEGRQYTINARTILIASGTNSSTISDSVAGLQGVKIFGDASALYSGSVVKAIASAKFGYKSINEYLACNAKNKNTSHSDFFALVTQSLQTRVVKMKRLSNNILEIVINAPLAVKNFKPGQFYRLQGARMEPVALTGAKIENDCISLIVLETGGSSSLCRHIKIGDFVSLMGPVGTPTEIPQGKVVLLIGGGLGNAVLFSIGQEMKNNGCKVLYCAGYKKLLDRFKIEELYNASDVIIWACEEEKIKPTRVQDVSYIGNIINALLSYANNSSESQNIPLSQVEHVIIIGSEEMMHAVSNVFDTVLHGKLKEGYQAFAVMNSPMQCMMQGICAQCLQSVYNPVTQKKELIYSCKNQDQPMHYVDFGCLKRRLKQNSLQEKLTAKWIEEFHKK